MVLRRLGATPRLYSSIAAQTVRRAGHFSNVRKDNLVFGFGREPPRETACHGSKHAYPQSVRTPTCRGQYAEFILTIGAIVKVR
jgi:hypothetical protein